MVKQFEVGKTYRYTGKIGDPTPFILIGIDEQDALFIVSGKPLVCTYAEKGYCPDVGFEGMYHENDGWAFISLYDLFDEVKETTVAKEKQKEEKKEKQKEEKKDMPKFEVGKKYRYNGSTWDKFDFTGIGIDEGDAEYIVSGEPLTVEFSKSGNGIKFEEFKNPWWFSRTMLEKFEEVIPYAERQAQWVKANGVKKGTKVLITRGFSATEDGSYCSYGTEHEHKANIIGRIATVSVVERCAVHVCIESKHWKVPFTALEIIKEQKYAERQAEWVKQNKIEKGSKVRLVATATSHEDGWENTWVDKMSEHVGQIGTVICGLTSTSGMCVSFGESMCSGFEYPYFVLEAVKETPVYGEPVASPKKDYLERQTEWATRNDVKVGTKVRVTRIAEDNEDGWNNGWVGQMNNSVGKVGTVLWGLDTSYGLSIKFEGDDEDMMSGYGYPFFVLEVVKDTHTPIKPTKPTKPTKPVKEFETGKWYVCHLTERPADWNPSGKMDALLDGKPHKCTFGKGHLAEFEGMPQRDGGWSFWGDLDYFEEVPAPSSEVDWQKKYTELKRKAIAMLSAYGDASKSFREELEAL